MVDEDRDVVQTAQRAKAVTPQLRSLTRHRKDEALLAMAAALGEGSGEIVAANAAAAPSPRLPLLHRLIASLP